ncbi:hypothetical protein BDV27DRAFT_44030 [Aspergillus caelatus]|uniref:Zinc finger Mcm10/DnaG-type domain-containing protein n=1 Tax=Aspergillus caelatus TaxID=61420 RepID=A0A5N6ZTB3_9EURO|nr:uncharacterized protein BDV27DRAFT_44030 [Aspergillus caelatus]KAE8360169.1 hypothetical protein BDV27DRAFT_44030 [Aspergillus caelatus]
MTGMVDISWPPKSPREALLSSPSGRKKYEDMQRRRENFGSPLKRSTTTPDLRTRSGQLLEDGLEDDDDEDDDEETLKLKLAAIEARLKLKQLQKNRGKPGTSGSDTHNRDDALSKPGSAVSASSRSQDNISRMKSTREATSRLEPNDVQVPLSPTRRPTSAVPPASPRRYILGIDKGLKGGDVSLKRPPSSRSTGRPTSGGGIRDGMALHSHTALTQALAGEPGNRPKSFSERMAESRSADKLRRERAERLQVNRSSAFQFDKAEVDAFKAAAEARKGSPTRSPTRNRQAESFSREDILRSCNNLKPVGLKRSQTLPSVRRNLDQDEPGSYLHRRNQKSESEAQAASSISFEHTISDESREGSASDKTPDSSKFEAFSSLHLSNRILPHSFLTRTLADKKVLRIPDLLRTVKGPAFELPEAINGDYVVFGIVASKSEPRDIKDSKKVSGKEADPFDEGLNNSSRYMCIQLTDLKWTIDLFLFDTAFPRYYRLSEGILIAILNPTILPPPKHKLDTNKFSLAISSSDDKVLEIGYAQDIGFCKAVRKDGKTCQAWVDARKTEFCDFHIDIQVRRTQSQRMGVNSGTGMFGPGGRSGSRTGFFGGGKEKGEGPRKGLKPNGAQYDFQSQSLYYVAPAPKSRAGNSSSFVMPGGQSAAKLIDADDEDPFIAAGRMGRGMENKEERFRRRLVEQQRERDIAQKLTSRGIGMGAEYLRARNPENVSSPLPENITPAKTSPNAETPSSHSGLLGFRKANSVKLGPLKRAHDGTHGSSVKKTRFITAKGIKEAGRDSLGKAEATKTGFDDDDDDELDII